MGGGITRREVLVLGVVDAAGLAVLPVVLAACGNSTPTPASSATAAASATPSELPAATPGSTPPPTPQPTPEPLGYIDDTRVVFPRTELTLTNPSGALLNLVATDGGVGIRFYKDFSFGHEQDRDHPWHMGWIEGRPKGYEGLAILRDWAFTAALWDADGKLTVGSLDSHPPSNPPADARFQVRGTLDEVQVRIDGTIGQNADILEVTSANGLDTTRPPTPRLAVTGKGDTVLGSSAAPTALVIHDAVTGKPYAITVTNGKLVATPAEG